MAMEIKRVLSKSVGLEDWVEVGSKIRFDGKICLVTKIEPDGDNYKVYMTDGGFATYDSQNKVRPLFAINALPVQSGNVYEMVLTDVTAVQSEEPPAEEEKKASEEPGG